MLLHEEMLISSEIALVKYSLHDKTKVTVIQLLNFFQVKTQKQSQHLLICSSPDHLSHKCEDRGFHHPISPAEGEETEASKYESDEE